MPTTTSPPDRRMLLSHGQMTFDECVTGPMRDIVRDMWVNRLESCNGCRTEGYLRDNDEATHYSIAGRSYTYATFRRSCRVLFALRRLLHPVGIRMHADVAGLHAEMEGSLIVTTGVFTIVIAGIVVRRGEARATVVRRGGRWVWGEIIDTPISRRERHA